MKRVRSIATMQRLACDWRHKGFTVGFVPTMGYLHAGHLSLIKRARQLIGPRGKLVVSIYVNPSQFGPHEDFSNYPRDLARDLKLCRAEGTEVVFTPTDKAMYPRNNTAPFSTYVVEEALSQAMEGTSRPTHFRGVATVVAKLFNIVQPSLAVFGAKDYQQAAIIKRLVRDLNFPLQIVVAPIRREFDGLAMSSRNKYLEGHLRMQALVLWKAIKKIRATIRAASQPVAASALKKQVRTLVEQQPAARLDYIEFFQPETLTPLHKVTRRTHMALAVFVGNTRLIDNSRL
jgi:pantoate--beta-alanine ligase